jgi:hypothetical protein
MTRTLKALAWFDLPSKQTETRLIFGSSSSGKKLSDRVGIVKATSERGLWVSTLMQAYRI